MQTRHVTNKVWDVIVIGGGPAGMMAAGRAAQLGSSVLLLEKNSTLGVKLLITGGGRCNVTNNEPDLRTLVSRYKGSDQFLFSAFSQHSNKEALEFFHAHQMPTKVENEQRVFPASNTASSVWEVLVTYMRQGAVEILCGAPVIEIILDKEKQFEAIRLADGSQIKGRHCIVAVGGSSRPETGSTGDGFKWLKSLGHKIIPVSRALVPIALKDAWVKKLQGVALSDIKLTTWLDGQKEGSRKGKILFTHFGITGPTVLNMSRSIGELLPYGDVVITLDLIPKLDHGQLKEKLHGLLAAQSNKKIKNSLAQMIPAALVSVVLDLVQVNPETFSHSVSREARTMIISTMKAIPLQVKELLGSDKAVVSSGGVDLSEVNFKTMQSRLIPNLYVIGDVLNIDRPSGGFSLQLCWTTGTVAGSHAAGKK